MISTAHSAGPSPDSHAAPLPFIQVAAGVIYNERGEVFACRRGYGKNPATDGLWEFPGGKIEAGETPREALIRELREELDIEVTTTDTIAIVEHTYPTFTIRLHFIACRLISGTPVLKEHSEMAWMHPGDLSTLDFCPADIPAHPLIPNSL